MPIPGTDIVVFMFIMVLRKLFMWEARQELGKQVPMLSFTAAANGLLLPSSKEGVTERKQYFPVIFLNGAGNIFFVFRHSSKFPNSYRFPLNIPEGILPHESNTKEKYLY